MRKLKFRVWDKKRRHWLAQNSFTIDGLGNVGDATGHRFKDADDFSEPMQFTGLKDRNGKDIYEGDILRVWFSRYEDEPELNKFTDHRVVYGIESDYPAFDLMPSLDCGYNGLQAAVSDFGGEDPIDCEVTGNIYENPGAFGG